MYTFLCEVESILNSRQLTSNSDDASDLEPIKPNHFQVNHHSPNLPPGEFNTTDLKLQSRYRGVQAATNMYWQRFTKEYIPLLTTRKKWTEKSRNIRNGDLVLIVMEKTPRGEWPLGKVVNCYPGNDKIVRTLKLKTARGYVNRPVAKVCLLEGSNL